MIETLNGVSTVGRFLALVAALQQLPPDTPFTIGVGNALYEESTDAAEATARRELTVGDALYVMCVVALSLEPGIKGGVEARLVIDSVYADGADSKAWKDYVCTEALRLGIIEPSEQQPNQNNDSHETEERENGGRSFMPDFDPDRDAIGI